MARAEGPQNSFSECLMDGKETTAAPLWTEFISAASNNPSPAGLLFLVIMIIGVVGCWMDAWNMIQSAHVYEARIFSFLAARFNDLGPFLCQRAS
jgi:hypothetical protein